jgi:hypothetical protein
VAVRGGGDAESSGVAALRSLLHSFGAHPSRDGDARILIWIKHPPILRRSKVEVRREELGDPGTAVQSARGKPVPEDGVVLGRPAGLDTGRDGALYISDDNRGFIYGSRMNPNEDYFFK